MADAVNTGSDCGSAPHEVSVSFPSEEYECKICYNYFDADRHKPKLLGCSHTFCLECLDSLHFREGRGWRIGCPLCRHRTPVPEYRVHNLPDNTTVADTLPINIKLARHSDELVNTQNTDVGLSVSSTSQDSNESCHTCRQVALITGCVCATFCFLSMLVLLFLGLVFVHNFNNTPLPVGAICLSVASILALFSAILTWCVCLLINRPESESRH